MNFYRLFVCLCGFMMTVNTTNPDEICGLKIDPFKSICCGGEEYPKFVGSQEQKCCSGELYVNEEADCCSGTLRGINKKLSRDEQICCGNSFFNQTVEICCNQIKYERNKYKCEKTRMNDILLERNQMACYKKDTPEDYRVYNTDTAGFSECCGKYLLDPRNTTHECYNEEIVLKQKTLHCGDQEYSQDKVCCHDTGKLIPIPDSVRYHDGVQPRYQCVNDQFVDNFKSQVIQTHDGKHVVPLQATVCGGTYYYENLREVQVLCCQGVIHYIRHGSNIQCCGNATINPDERTCCNGIIYPLKQLCCGDKLYDRDQDDEICCQQRLINPHDYLCCDVFGQTISVKKNSSADDKCCGLNSYNSDQKGCCASRIVDKWNSTTHECWYGEVIDKVKILRDIINKTTTNKKPSQQKAKEMGNGCMVCTSEINLNDTCTKRYEYRFVVLEIYRGRMDVVLLSPRRLEGIVITLRSRKLCTDIQKHQSYSIFTNRNYQERILDQDFSLSFKRRDVIAKLEMEEFTGKKKSRMSPCFKCKLDRFHKSSRS